MDRKGFFFIIMAFVLLAYILTSTYFWVRAIEMEESRYSESFRTSTMDMLLAQVTEESVTGFTNISARYAFYRLNHHSILNPVLPAGTSIQTDSSLDGSENENIKLAMHDLIMYGSASADYFDGGELAYTNAEKLTYSLAGWGSQLNASLAASGFELLELGVEEGSFEFAQTNFTEFEVSFVMNLTIKDSKMGSATSLVRTYNVHTTVDATGMVDPYIARESEHLDLEEESVPVRVGKPVFMAPIEYYPDGFESLCSEQSSDCYYIESEDQGQGWFYGPMIDVEDASPIASNENISLNYILVGNYSDIIALSNHTHFGAYILTNEPVLGGDCADDESETFNPMLYDNDTGCTDLLDTFSDPEAVTDKPFMVSEGFDINDYQGVNLPGPISAHKILFVAAHTPSEVLEDTELKEDGGVSLYDIEMLRDFVMCGYYLPRNESPSFLHRMFDLQDMFDEPPNPAYENWPESQWGIETTAVGRWAGGNLVSGQWDEYSRVDVEFFSKIEDGSGNPVQMIKGMPGDKSAIMCSMDLGETTELEHVGHFRLSDWAQWIREHPDIYWIELDDGDIDNIGCDNEDVAGCDVSD